MDNDFSKQLTLFNWEDEDRLEKLFKIASGLNEQKYEDQKQILELSSKLQEVNLMAHRLRSRLDGGKMIIEYEGKRYPVVGQNDEVYLVTEPYMEEIGESFSVPKSEAKVIIYG